MTNAAVALVILFVVPGLAVGAIAAAAEVLQLIFWGLSAPFLFLGSLPWTAELFPKKSVVVRDEAYYYLKQAGQL